jgi:hypothetical protein
VGNFPNLQGILLPINDPRIDPFNPSCLSNGGNLAMKSSVIIRSGSFQSNRTYQFMVFMQNKQNSTLTATGYVLVRIEDTYPKMIAIG